MAQVDFLFFADLVFDGVLILVALLVVLLLFDSFTRLGQGSLSFFAQRLGVGIGFLGTAKVMELSADFFAAELGGLAGALIPALLFLGFLFLVFGAWDLYSISRSRRAAA